MKNLRVFSCSVQPFLVVGLNNIFVRLGVYIFVVTNCVLFTHSYR